jgi:hypothetical protein
VCASPNPTSTTSSPKTAYTVADVAAAMLVAGNGRGRLSDSGRDALDAAMEGDNPEDDSDKPVIY